MVLYFVFSVTDLSLLPQQDVCRIQHFTPKVSDASVEGIDFHRVLFSARKGKETWKGLSRVGSPSKRHLLPITGGQPRDTGKTLSLLPTPLVYFKTSILFVKSTTTSKKRMVSPLISVILQRSIKQSRVERRGTDTFPHP